jgi:CheY-like chemotaxis protein
MRTLWIEPERGSAMAGESMRPVVVLVGQAAQRAWDAVNSDALPGDHAALGAVRRPDLGAAIDWIERERVEPALVVIAQAWPGEIGHGELMRLRQAAPLARICGLFASWCEGETRSGRPWPGAWRVFGHQWPQRGARQLAALAAEAPSVWNLPVTATAEEQLFVEIDLLARRKAAQTNGVVPTDDQARHSRIVVVAPVAETGSALADACRALGYQAVVWRETPASGELAAAAMLWDTQADRAARADTVENLRRGSGGAPIVALLGFPRPEQIERARAAGVAAVVSKPFLLADLDWQLEMLLRRV